MNKFLTLVIKEVKELITPQVILPLVLTAVLFSVLGNVIGKEVEKAKAPSKIVVTDFDRTATSKSISDILKNNNFEVTYVENMPVDDAIKKAKELNNPLMLKIPAGFEAGIQSVSPQKVESYSIMRSFSLLGTKDSAVLSMAMAAMNSVISDQIISSKVTGLNPANVKNPIQVSEHVVVGEKTAQANALAVINFIAGQTTFIPIILFIVIVFAAQMIATSMATEKENKTLETLLSTPVSRKAIVGAKMVGASIIAFFSSLVYMFGFRSYINGVSGAAGGATGSVPKEALNQLGLSLTTSDYVLLGISLFASILVALSIALIIGAFTEDVKSVQGTITPLMVLMIIPYMLVMFLDFNSLSTGVKWLVYAIPFSHTFLAAPNLFLGNYQQVIYGTIYELIVFIGFLFLAAKIFSTDLISTMKLNFGKKKS